MGGVGGRMDFSLSEPLISTVKPWSRLGAISGTDSEAVLYRRHRGLETALQLLKLWWRLMSSYVSWRLNDVRTKYSHVIVHIGLMGFISSANAVGLVFMRRLIRTAGFQWRVVNIDLTYVWRGVPSPLRRKG